MGWWARGGTRRPGERVGQAAALLLCGLWTQGPPRALSAQPFHTWPRKRDPGTAGAWWGWQRCGSGRPSAARE